ncbi:ribonuclease III family protein [Desulfocucumis palustris]|uniref:Mini-ribonuclease 3 n=1 Tax=Desulfocucumis palustris TaxID=1898651 RepID=A0A2L2XJ42_9FIRM|nr:ribonuclease III domain-containing protein [Desulfocucumis palustris]GBF35723.1 ribonuclease III family protein [Desulfocucumis palustris]
MDKIFKPLDLEQVNQLSPLELAYVGDAVYELAVRRHLIARGIVGANRLHREAVKYVRADTQAQVLRTLESQLYEEEIRIAKRGRNAKSGHAHRGTCVTAYRQSTGLESLVGYLFLRGNMERLGFIMQWVFKIVENNE